MFVYNIKNLHRLKYVIKSITTRNDKLNTIFPPAKHEGVYIQRSVPLEQLLHLQIGQYTNAWLLATEKVPAKATQLKANSYLSTAEMSGKERRSVNHADSPTE